MSDEARDLIEFVADWAHDCSPSNAATPWDHKHSDEIDPRSYGFDDIEERCRAALVALSTTPAPSRHTLLFPPHPGEVYQSSALCSCGEWQFDSDSPGDLFNETRPIRQQWTEHAFGAPRE